MRTQLEAAAAWVADLALSDVPPHVVTLARLQQLDILASLTAGARTRVGKAIIAAVPEHHGAGTCLALPIAKRCTLLDAVYLHATLANALELDNFVFAGHTGQAAVGVTLALGQLTQASGEQALLAQIAANEVAGRLGAVMTAGPQHGHMKSYLHRLAAAVVAARLLQLDERRIANAMAIALSMPEYPLFPGAFSADTKALCTGDPCVAGVRASYLAAEGVEPARDILEHEVGLVTSLSENRSVPRVWQSLGLTWSLEAICFKPIAACAYAAAAALATERAVKAFSGPWSAERVKRVEVQTTVLSVTMEGFSAPHEAGRATPTNTNFSTRRTVALALLTGDAPVGASFQPDTFEALAPDIVRTAERVELSHHWPYTIDLLRGVDAAIDHPGRPGIYGMGEAHRTLARFRQAFDTPAALSLTDVPTLLRLPRVDGGYLLRRYLVGLRARLPFLDQQARADYCSRETDLSRMALRFAAGVRIHLDDGRTLSDEVLVPDGFAGAPQREHTPRQKFSREVGDAVSPAFALKLLALLDAQQPLAPDALVAAWATALPGALP